MKYTVEATQHVPSIVIATVEANGVKNAKETANWLKDQHPNCKIFVSFFRSSDGQHGYLNPDGNHAITGQAW